MKHQYSYLTSTCIARLAISTLIVLLIAGQMPVHLSPAISANFDPAPNLNMPEMRGEEAVSYLKQQGLHSSLSEAMDAARYRINRTEQSAYQGSNPRQGYQSTFTPEEVVVTGRSGDQSDGWRWGMKLKGVGYGDHLLETEPGEITTKDNRIEIRKQWSVVSGQWSVASDVSSRITHHASLVEWYENRPEGLEQGFTLLERPAINQGDQPLRVVMEMSGGLRAKAADSGRSVRLFDEPGGVLLLYDHLKAWDAEGRDLASRMKVEGRELVLEVDDRERAYPLTIDPMLSQEAKLTASDASIGDGFGFSVSISGNTAIVGSPLDDDAGDQSGSAYVFVRSGTSWTQQQKLTADDAEAGDRFGRQVSISGDSAIIGARFDNDAGSRSGSAYVFVRTGTVWSQQQKLTADDAAALDEFGSSVSISGDTAIVGSPRDDDAGGESGSAYVFVRNGTSWTQQQKLTADDAASDKQFGFSVSIDEDTAIVGAQFDDDGGSASGSAYVFVRTGTVWDQQQKLTAGDAAPGDFFGFSVSIDEDTAIVGARFDDNAGSAYVFVRSGTSWTQQQKLTADDAEAFDQVVSVSISGDSAIIGVPGGLFGSAYVFVRSGTMWTQQQQLTASDASIADGFGISVSISGNTAIVGSPQDDDACPTNVNCNSGSAYVFAPETPDNTPPAIAAESVNIARDSSLSSELIANVSDAEDDPEFLTVTVDGGSSSTVNGVTVSNITIASDGQVRADISATCDASDADFTLEVTDSGGLTASDTLSVTPINETEPPQITTILTHLELWSPDHSYRTINVTDCVLSVSDNCDTGLSVSDVVIAQVTSDEPENSSDDGNTVNDIVIAADCKSVMLRAERNGVGNGRVYTITFEVTDASGNVGTATCKVTVPLNQDGQAAIDDGVAYGVVSSCASP